MENNTQEQISELKKEVAQLKALVYKGRFSNLIVHDTPVQFRFPNLYTAYGGTISSGTSAGKIEIKINGVSKFIPYFN